MMLGLKSWIFSIQSSKLCLKVYLAYKKNSHTGSDTDMRWTIPISNPYPFLTYLLYIYFLNFLDLYPLLMKQIRDKFVSFKCNSHPLEHLQLIYSRAFSGAKKSPSSTNFFSSHEEFGFSTRSRTCSVSVPRAKSFVLFLFFIYFNF